MLWLAALLCLILAVGASSRASIDWSTITPAEMLLVAPSEFATLQIATIKTIPLAVRSPDPHAKMITCT
jgi:hypothetical protein